MKLKHLALTLILAVTSAFGQGDVVSGIKAVNRYFNQRPTQKHAILSTGECAAGIAFSANPAGAAIVGLPVLALGNGLGYFLRNAQATPYTPNVDVVSFFHNAGRYIENHPTLLQDASGTFCMSYGLTRSGRTKPAAKSTPTPKHNPTPKPDPTQTGAGDTGGSNGGTGTGTGSTGGDSGGAGSGSGSGSGGSGSGSGGNSGGGPGSGGNGNGCIQDCGFPGNGGVNGGNDTKKPPFPGHGPKKH